MVRYSFRVFEVKQNLQAGNTESLIEHAILAFSQVHAATYQRIFLSDYITITPYELKTSLIERGALIVLAHHLQS